MYNDTTKIKKNISKINDFIENSSEEELKKIANEIRNKLDKKYEESMIKKAKRYFGKYYKDKDTNEHFFVIGINEENEMIEALSLRSSDFSVEVVYKSFSPVPIHIFNYKYTEISKETFEDIFKNAKESVERLYTEALEKNSKVK